MKFMTTWAIRPGDRKEAVDRFLAGLATPPEGVTLLGRWHKSDCSGGFTLIETDNPLAVFEDAAFWTDVLDMQTTVVLDDLEAGPIVAKIRGK
jgi:hypothetical protein